MHQDTALGRWGRSCLSHPLAQTKPCSKGKEQDAHPCLSNPSPPEHLFKPPLSSETGPAMAQRHALACSRTENQVSCFIFFFPRRQFVHLAPQPSPSCLCLPCAAPTTRRSGTDLKMKEFCRVLFNWGHCSAPFQHSASHMDFVGQEQVAKMGDSKLGDHQTRWSAHGSAA